MEGSAAPIVRAFATKLRRNVALARDWSSTHGTDSHTRLVRPPRPDPHRQPFVSLAPGEPIEVAPRHPCTED
jgi:hypothetical protein